MDQTFQTEQFWEAVSQIQKTHALFFPPDQIKNILIIPTDKGYELQFAEEHQIDNAIIAEIQLAFKLTLQFPDPIQVWRPPSDHFSNLGETS